jgi:hypothetical protein
MLFCQGDITLVFIMLGQQEMRLAARCLPGQNSFQDLHSVSGLPTLEKMRRQLAAQRQVVRLLLAFEDQAFQLILLLQLVEEFLRLGLAQLVACDTGHGPVRVQRENPLQKRDRFVVLLALL